MIVTKSAEGSLANKLYCQVDDVGRLLRRITDKIVIGKVSGVGERPDIYEYEIEQFVWDVDRNIDAMLSKMYVVPLVKCTTGINAGYYPPPIKQMSQYMAAYEIFVAIFAGNLPNELPKAVEYWRDQANELMGLVLKGKIDLTKFGQTLAEDVNAPLVTGGLPQGVLPPLHYTKKGIEGIEQGEIDITSEEYEY